MSQEQPNNPLHGIKLADVLQFLVSEYGWEELSDEVNNPSINSSLKFLRRTPWARDKVEKLYLKSI
jgi:uncharacterized protein (DUF2132 family)